MKKNIILISAAALLAFACAKENTAKPVVFEHKEYSAKLYDTKVSIGEFDTETSKVSLDWTAGDVVKIVYPSATCEFTVTSIDKGIATLAGTAPVEETATEAWYPGEYFDGEKVVLPAVQHQDRLPVVLKGAVDGNNIEFASTSETAIICYPLTGELLVKEAYLYLTTDTPNLFGSLVTMDITKYGADKAASKLEPTYTLEFDEPIQLTNEPQYICFAVPAVDKYATLEIKVPAPEGAIVSDYKLARKKLTKLTLSSGDVKKMPTLNFTNSDTNIAAQRWAFGKNHGGKTGIKERTNENVWTLQDDYVECKLYQSGTTMKLNAYMNEKLMAPNIIYPGNHRYVAIKSDIIYAMRNPSSGLPLANPSWDLRLADQVGSTTWSFQFVGTSRARYSGAIDCNEPNVTITYFDLLQEFNNNFYNTTSPISSKGMYFVQQISYTDNGQAPDKGGTSVYPDITTKIYFIGFFNSIEEIEAYNASLEN